METKYIGFLAKIKNGFTAYYHVDHLGSTRQMTDSKDALFTDYLVYNLFGNIYARNAGDERYHFNGKEKDSTGKLKRKGFERETLGVPSGARYCDPEVGRFVLDANKK